MTVQAKLNYDPLELDPEDMLPFASTRPHALAAYSVGHALSWFGAFFSRVVIKPLPALLHAFL